MFFLFPFLFYFPKKALVWGEDAVLPFAQRKGVRQLSTAWRQENYVV